MVTCMLAGEVKRTFSTLGPMCFNCSSVKVVFLRVCKPMHQLVQQKNALASLLPLRRFWYSPSGTRYPLLLRTICVPQIPPPFYFHIIWVCFLKMFLLQIIIAIMQLFSLPHSRNSDVFHLSKLIITALRKISLSWWILHWKENRVGCGSESTYTRERQRKTYYDTAWKKHWLTTFRNL